MECISETELDQLNTGDYFRNKVFDVDYDGTINWRNERKFELGCNIFHTLGAGGPWHWYNNQTQLVEWQREVETLPGDPLEFLYFLFYNQEMTASMISFKDHAATRTANWVVCTLARRNNPWDDFMNKQTQSFEDRGNAEMIPGFCKLLGLDQSEVAALFNNRQWSNLILYVLEERKNHFSI